MKQKIILLVMLVSIFGCGAVRFDDDRLEMKSFNDGRVHVMVDEASGDRYVVKHHTGRTYSVEKLPRRAFK